MEQNVPYRFNIINCEKFNSQFNFGKSYEIIVTVYPWNRMESPPNGYLTVVA